MLTAVSVVSARNTPRGRRCVCVCEIRTFETYPPATVKHTLRCRSLSPARRTRRPRNVFVLRSGKFAALTAFPRFPRPWPWGFGVCGTKPSPLPGQRPSLLCPRPVRPGSAHLSGPARSPALGARLPSLRAPATVQVSGDGFLLRPTDTFATPSGRTAVRRQKGRRQGHPWGAGRRTRRAEPLRPRGRPPGRGEPKEQRLRTGTTRTPGLK